MGGPFLARRVVERISDGSRHQRGMRSVFGQHEARWTQRISGYLLQVDHSEAPSGTRNAVKYTSARIRSGTCSLAWLITIPPRLWPTNTTGSGGYLTKFATKRAQRSSVIPDNAVLSSPIPGRSGAMTGIPQCSSKGVTRCRHQAPCHAP